jgi:hypothetical protein
MNTDEFSANDWLKKAGLTSQRHEGASSRQGSDALVLKGMSVHDATGKKLHSDHYCSAENAIKISKRRIKRLGL